jgi:UDP-2,3-diacylglucosamine pyrophosphatase LpxH
MKHKSYMAVTLGLILLLCLVFLAGGCSTTQPTTTQSSTTQTTTTQSTTTQSTVNIMTLTPNIAVSIEPSSPPVNNSVSTIKLKFSQPLDAKTITGAVKLYKLDTMGNPLEEPFIAKIDPTDPALLLVNNKAVGKLTDGEEYKVTVSQNLKSTTGGALEKDFTGYFATNHAFIPSGNPDLGNTRSQIVVISDIHLGVDDAFTETKENRQPLVDFLGQIRNSPNVKELVIAGDLIDEWFLPMDYIMPQTESALVDAIAANNRPVIDAFNNIITDGNIKVTYTPGNHDITVTQADIQRILPGINQARDAEQGLGTYITGTNAEIAIEHGHRYNFFCAPDPLSNRDITKNNTSILPPGYFFTRIATSSVVEKHPASSNVFPAITPNEKDPTQYGYYLYAKIWEAVLSGLPINESFSDKVIKTNIDGFTETYAVNDLVPQQDPNTGIFDVTLYKGIMDNWVERQKINGVAVPISLKDAVMKAADNHFTDTQANIQYFDRDASKRIVVFGHTHVVRNLLFTNPEGDNVIYANSGTWIDNAQGYPEMTFVVITLPNADSAIESVNVYKYSADKTITQWEAAQAITRW